MIEGGSGAADGMAELSDGELRSLEVSEVLFPGLGFGRLRLPRHREDPCVRGESLIERKNLPAEY